MTDTLVLNTDGLPLSLVPVSSLVWQESVKLIYIDRADAIAHYNDWYIHSPSITMQVPSVILLREYVKVSRGTAFSRKGVFLRDEYRCQYCGIDCSHNVSELTIDHVLPKHYGGKTSWTNSVTACQSCNFEKGHDLNIKPEHAPKRPTYYELVNKRMKFPITVPDQSWQEFLNWDPRLVTVKPHHTPAIIVDAAEQDDK